MQNNQRPSQNPQHRAHSSSPTNRPYMAKQSVGQSANTQQRAGQVNSQRVAQGRVARKSNNYNEVEELAYKRRYRAEVRAAKRAGIIAFFTVFLSLCLISLAVLHFTTKGSLPSQGPKEFMIMKIEGSPETEVPMSEAYMNDMLYVDFSAVAKLCEFTAIGDANGITYSFTDTNNIVQTIIIFYDSAEATINGHSVLMNGIAIKTEDSVKVPLKFIQDNIDGLEATVDEEARTVVITREKLTGSTPDSPKYEDIVLSLQPDIPIPPLSGSEDFKDPLDVEFTADLSEYEKYMNPIDKDAYLILVNKEHPVNQDFAPSELEYVPQQFAVYSGEYQATMAPIAAKALTAMLIEAKEYGITDVKVTLAYRNYWTQNWLYTNYVQDEINKGYSKEEAERIAATYSAPPGKSEHQTGLCADMHNVYFQNDKELEDFEYTDAYKWLKDNCWKFGFVIRFPKGKEDITGFQFECWHYRFVGRYHAYQMYTQDLCLEEYLEKLANED